MRKQFIKPQKYPNQLPNQLGYKRIHLHATVEDLVSILKLQKNAWTAFAGNPVRLKITID